MPRPLHLLAFCLAAAPATAQVTSTLTAASNLTVHASTPAGQQTATLPAGVWSGLQLACTDPSQAAGATYSAVATVDPFRAECVVDQTAWAAAVGGNALSGPNQVLWQIGANTLMPVRFELELSDSTQPGSAGASMVAVDFGDDGAIDWVDGQGWSPTSWLLGPTPLAIRIDTVAAVAQFGHAETRLTVRVLPNNPVHATFVSIGCGISTGLEIEPTFLQTGLAFTFTGMGGVQPRVLVFGFAPQPVLLPQVYGQMCLLLPSPDVLLPHTQPGPLHLPVPWTLPPFTLWLQGAHVTSHGIELTASYRLDKS